MSYDPRDLEWERRYEHGDTPWDKGIAAPPLTQYLREGRISGSVLVPGCGKGHEVRALAAQPDITAVGLDLSPAAISQAKELISDAAPNPRISFLVGDFFQLPEDLRGSFDWIVEHTCFCAIDPRQRPEYILAAATALRPAGKIFGIFYLDPDTETGPPFAITREELLDLFAPRFTLLESWIPKQSFPGRENRELVCLLQKR